AGEHGHEAVTLLDLREEDVPPALAAGEVLVVEGLVAQLPQLADQLYDDGHVTARVAHEQTRHDRLPPAPDKASLPCKPVRGGLGMLRTGHSLVVTPVGVGYRNQVSRTATTVT